MAGKISAAPSPMTARAAISWPGLLPSPPATRGDSEDGQSREQHALAPDAVAEIPGREHERGEHQVVGVDDPLQLRRRGVEVAHQRRQRDVDDRRVQVDREGGEEKRAEDQSLVLHRLERYTRFPSYNTINLCEKTHVWFAG